MLSINKKIVKTWTSIITALSLMVISISVYSQDSTIYVKTNTNPFASPFYLFSNTPNGESINVTLEKGSTYTFIRTDGAHPFNIGDGWKQENSQIQYSSTGTGGVVGNTASIDIDEQLTITIPSDFNGSQLTYFCYPHSTMKSTFAVVEPSDNSADQPASWDFDGNGEADALTDGLLLLRYAFNLRDEALTNGAIASGSIMSSQEVQEAVTLALDIADIDANGEVDALTDGLLLLRYLFNLRGESLVNGAIASDASNSSYVDVEEYIASLMPGQILARASGLLVQMKSTQEFSANFTQSYSRTFGEVSDMVALEAMPETAMDAATSDSGGDSFTTTYTLEKTIDEHDFVKYDGEHLFIAPSYSMYEDCCFVEPMVMIDDAISVDEIAVLEEEIEELDAEIVYLQRKLEDLDAELEYLDVEIVNLQARIAEEYAQAVAQQEELDNLQNQLDESQALKAELISELSSLASPELELQLSEIDAVESEIEYLEYLIQELINPIVTLEIPPDPYHDLHMLYAARDEGVAELLDAEAELLVAESERADLTNELEELRASSVSSPQPSQPSIPELRSIKIMSTDPDQATVSEAGNILIDDNRTIEGLYTNGDQLASISTSGWWGMYGSAFMDPSIWRGQTTGVSVYDISNVSAPELDWKFEIEGGFVTSRKKGDIVYLVARHTPQIDYYIDYPTIEQRDANEELLEDVSSTDILPKAFINGEETDLLSATDCLMINDEHEYAPDQYGYPTMTLLVAVDVKNKQLVNTTCYLEPTSGVYVSQYGIYFIQSEGWGDDSRTLIHRFNLSSSLAYSGSGKVNGHLYGSGQMDFRINEHDGYLRVVSSQWTGDSEDNRDHQLTVLKHSPAGYSMDQVATLPNEEYPNEIGKPNEDLYGVRFFGDTLYLVTFERTDPLYVVDLSEQENPVIAGELEVTGFSDFLHPVNDDLLLGLGQDENGLVKLELFNVASMDNPVSLTALSIGEGSSWVHSPARYNRHAFTYQQVNDNQDRFTIPVTLSSNTAAGYTQENRLYMFNLFNKDVSDSASIMNSGFISGGSNNWWSNNDRQRSFIHNSTVFYVNDQNVIPSFWQYPED